MTRLAPSLIHCTTDRATSPYSRCWFTFQKTRLAASLIHRTTDRATSPYSRRWFTSQKTPLTASLIHRTTGRRHYTAAVLSAVSRLWTTPTSVGVAESQDVVWTVISTQPKDSVLCPSPFAFCNRLSQCQKDILLCKFYTTVPGCLLHIKTHSLSGHSEPQQIVFLIHFEIIL